MVIGDDQYNSDEREGSVSEVSDDLKDESGSLLFKKVTIQKPSKGEGGENSTASPHTNGPPTVPRGDSLLSINSGCTSAAGEKRKVSFNDGIQVEEEEVGGANAEGVGEMGGAGLRRLLYRHRQTISKMLHDGENHEVWRPGMRLTRKTDSQVHNQFKCCV